MPNPSGRNKVAFQQRANQISSASGRPRVQPDDDKGGRLLSGVLERNMDRSVDSIGSCSLDVDADSTDFSGE